MTTAFQPDLFQSDSFQIAGGVAATDFQVTFAIIQDGDVVSLNIRLPDSGAGSSKRRRRDRYIARFKGEEYEFSDLQALEDFVAQAVANEKPKPKSVRAPVKITLSPDFVEEIQEVRIEPPKRLAAMPQSAALAQVRRIEAMFQQRCEEDEDDILCLL